MIIVFPLVAYCKNRHRFGIIYLKQRNIASVAKWNHQFPQKGCVSAGFSTCKRKILKQCHALRNRIARALGCAWIVIQ